MDCFAIPFCLAFEPADSWIQREITELLCSNYDGFTHPLRHQQQRFIRFFDLQCLVENRPLLVRREQDAKPLDGIIREFLEDGAIQTLSETHNRRHGSEY